jgi:hypothetical protein
MFLLKPSLVVHYKVIVVLLIFINSLSIGQFESLNNLAQIISENLDAYQVTIFINRSERIKIPEQNTILEKLMHFNPSVVIDISKFDNTTINKYLQPKVIENPTYTSMNIILINGESNDTESEIIRIQGFLDFSINLSPALMRPKSLIIFLYRTSLPINLFEKIFKYVWKKRFLDFSIIEINLNNNVIKNITGYLHYFNPFFNTFIKEPYLLERKIFIDKLINLNQYPIILLLLNHTIFLKVTTDRHNNIKVSGLHYLLLLTALEKMNFKIVYYISNINSTINTIIYNHSLNLLEQGYVNMFSVAYAYLSYDFPAIDIGYNGLESFIAIVPIITYTNIKIPYSTLILLFIVPLFITFIIKIAYWLKIQKQKLDVLYVAQILYGVPVTIYPQKWSDRMIFFGIVCISIQYSMDYFSKLVDDYMINNEVLFDRFKDIADSPFDIYINEKYKNVYLNDDNINIKRIKKKVKIVNDIYKCINLFKKPKNVICLTSKIYADYSSTLYLDDNSKPRMKISKPIFAQEKLRFLCEKYLPYGARLKNLFQKLHQTGISTFLQKKYLNTNRIAPKIKTKKSSNKLTFLCYLILCIGYFFSFIALFVEIILFRIRNRNREDEL